jgi:polyhydroxyalkanoate synthesis regulator phasin
MLTLIAMVPGLGFAKEKEKLSYGEGLIVNIPLPEAEVEQVVEDVAQNGMIRGTKEYNKDEFISGAKLSGSPRVFPAWTEAGKAIYKVREQAIDPRNFKESSDVGTLAVRYVVLPQGEKNTVLRIDALFQEDFRHTVHKSDGSIESAEYKDIREHLDTIEVMKSQDAEAKRERQEYLARKQNPAVRNEGVSSSAVPQASVPQAPAEAAPQPVENNPETATPQNTVVESEAAESAAPPPAPAQTLEERLKELRKQVQRLVKAPGAPLKSAPFHTAGTLQLLTPGTEVLILITSHYWYGVETHEGQHGWMQRDQLEALQ